LTPTSPRSSRRRFCFQFGTGPIRGFATTLVFGSWPTCLPPSSSRGRCSNCLVAKARWRDANEHLTRALRHANPYQSNFNFIKWRWHAIVLSIAVIGAGAITILQRGGLPLGVDFSGGSVVILHFDQPVAEDAVRARCGA
jgi:hypothetical protein